MIIVIGGPTASGKSAVALALAELLDGEIVGADSRQLYRGLPIASAAPSVDDKARVPHHLYESIDPAGENGATLSAATFMSLADNAVDGIVRRGKTAIVVGGSGLYLRALRLGLDDALPADAALKRTLEEDLARDGLAALVSRLRDVDVDAANSIDRNNPVRVLRALEIALLGGNAGGRSIEALLARAPRSRFANAHFLLVQAPALTERIDARTRAMFGSRGSKSSPIVDEATALAGQLPLEHALLQTIGVHEALLVALGVCGVDAAIEAAATRTRQYARRQRTWFKKEPWWTPCPNTPKGEVDVDAVAALLTEAS